MPAPSACMFNLTPWPVSWPRRFLWETRGNLAGLLRSDLLLQIDSSVPGRGLVTTCGTTAHHKLPRCQEIARRTLAATAHLLLPSTRDRHSLKRPSAGLT